LDKKRLNLNPGSFFQKGTYYFCKNIFLILFLIPLISSGQEASVQRVHIINGLFLGSERVGLTYSFEQPFSKSAVLKIEPILIVGSGNTNESDEYSGVWTCISVEPRLYYTFARRYAANRSTTNNSANFLALSIDYTPGLGFGKNIHQTSSLFINPNWGLRRTIFKLVIFDLSIGPYAYLSHGSLIWEKFPTFGFRLGCPIKKRSS
jgi:hypothetical protein